MRFPLLSVVKVTLKSVTKGGAEGSEKVQKGVT